MLEITSSGSLPDLMLLESLGTGRSEIRNRILAPIFKDLKLIEAWGTGIQKIREEVLNYNHIQFRFDEVHHSFRVQFAKIELKSIKQKSTKPSSISARQQKLLDFFEKNIPLQFEQIRQHFPKISKRTLQGDLTTLKREGLIKSQGYGRGSRWVLINPQIL